MVDSTIATVKNSESTIIFLHMPKTAGISLERILERNYTNTQVLKIHDAILERTKNYAALSDAERRNIKLIIGHMQFGIHQFLSTPFTYVTLLRDPIERHVSHFRHILRHRNNALREKFLQKKSFSDYLDHIEKEIGFTNGVTRQVSGYFGLYVNIFENLTEPFPPLPHEALDMAKHNLTTYFSVVGITERFDETALLMQKHLKLGSILHTNYNVNTKIEEPEVTPEMVERIRRFDAYDFELYEFAQQLMNNEIQAAGVGFAPALKWHQMQNAIYNQIADSNQIRAAFRKLPEFVKNPLRHLVAK